MDKIKTPIADAFRKWEKQATKEELQQFCDSANSLALTIRKHYDERKKIKDSTDR